jgi:transcriptional regulator with XRE-family HTH domain
MPGVREAAGIPQAKVAGLADRQIRRIEQGTCRATSRALNALARAHGLELNPYLDKLASELS